MTGTPASAPAGGLRVGVLGGGQLGRMLGLAGIPLGFHFLFLDPVASRSELLEGVDRLGYPAVLKTRRFGYDGKGRRAELQAAQAHRATAHHPDRQRQTQGADELDAASQTRVRYRHRELPRMRRHTPGDFLR